MGMIPFGNTPRWTHGIGAVSCPCQKGVEIDPFKVGGCAIFFKAQEQWSAAKIANRYWQTALELLDEVEDLGSGYVRLLLVNLGRDDARILHTPISDDAAILADCTVVHVGGI